jgi:hypothetical protein
MGWEENERILFTRPVREAAARDFEETQRRREEKLRQLEKDKEFITETARIQNMLSTQRLNDPQVFTDILRRITYLGIFLTPHKVERELKQIRDKRTKMVFQEYIRYCSRFHVSLQQVNSSFRVVPQPPFKSKFRVLVVDGRFRPYAPAYRCEKELVYSDLYASARVEFHPILEQMIKDGTAVGVMVKDKSGRSALNELEAFAYDPEKLTFVLHDAKQRHVYCLIGEKVSVDKVWKKAAKLVTALQREFYGRSKAGRPRNVPELQRTIAQLVQKRSLKDIAIENVTALGKPTEKAVAAEQVKLSRVAKKAGLHRYTPRDN